MFKAYIQQFKVEKVDFELLSNFIDNGFLEFCFEKMHKYIIISLII